jgi:hypothetical protein
MLAGCATTGDPRQGGLFGWSETKARDRQEERQQRVAGSEAELAREDTRTHHLEASNTGTDRQMAAARVQHERAEEDLRAEQTALIARTEQLENESPTPATASRARAFRRTVNTVAAQMALPVEQRRMRLRALEAEIDKALAQTGR